MEEVHFHRWIYLHEHITNEPLALRERDNLKECLIVLPMHLLALHGISGKKEYIKGQRKVNATRVGRKSEGQCALKKMRDTGRERQETDDKFTWAPDRVCSSVYVQVPAQTGPSGIWGSTFMSWGPLL